MKDIDNGKAYIIKTVFEIQHTIIDVRNVGDGAVGLGRRLGELGVGWMQR